MNLPQLNGVTCITNQYSLAKMNANSPKTQQQNHVIKHDKHTAALV